MDIYSWAAIALHFCSSDFQFQLFILIPSPTVDCVLIISWWWYHLLKRLAAEPLPSSCLYLPWYMKQKAVYCPLCPTQGLTQLHRLKQKLRTDPCSRLEPLPVMFSTEAGDSSLCATAWVVEQTRALLWNIWLTTFPVGPRTCDWFMGLGLI